VGCHSLLASISLGDYSLGRDCNDEPQPEDGMKSVLVTAIMPAHNAEQYICASIDSVLAQTVPCSLIVIDDASTDATPEHVREYVTRHPHQVTLVSLVANSGPSAARNIGIRRSKTPYVAFLDADDAWMPDKVVKQLALFQNDPSLGMVGCGVHFINGDGALMESYNADEFPNQESLINTLLVRSVLNGSASGVMLRRECFETVGCFDEKLRSSEDRDMWLRIACELSVANVSEPLTKVRIHSANAHKNIRIAMENKKRFIDKHYHSKGFVDRQKARSFVYLDAARECKIPEDRGLQFKYSFFSVISFPFPCCPKDDKYQLLLKSLLPSFVINISVQ
jgi:glycosyltransferase involved in cell wall biosynthesis